MAAFVPRDSQALQRENATVIPFVSMNEEDVRAGCAALNEVSPGAGADIEAVRRLAKRQDGDRRFLLAISFTRFPLEDETRPHLGQGLHFEVQHEDLPAGLALLRDPQGPEKEVERRRNLSRMAEEKTKAAWEQSERETRQAQEAQAALIRRREELGSREWEALSALAQAFYLATLALKSKDPAAAFRRIAVELSSGVNRGGVNQRLALPSEEWRE